MSNNNIVGSEPISLAQKRSIFQTIYNLGLNILPIGKYHDKHPCVKWKPLQTSRLDRQIFEAHLRRFESNDFWIVCGAYLTKAGEPFNDFGLVVVDGDDAEAVAEIEKRCPFTPVQTITCRGRHFVFRHPRTVRIPNKQKLLLNGTLFNIDIRADGGGVAAPGSTNKQWVEPWTPALFEAAPVFQQDWLPYENRSSEPDPFEPDFLEADDDIEFSMEERRQAAKEWLAEQVPCQQGRGACGASGYFLALTRTAYNHFALDRGSTIDVMHWWGQQWDKQLDANGTNGYLWTLDEVRHKVDDMVQIRPESRRGWRLWDYVPRSLERDCFDYSYHHVTIEEGGNDLMNGETIDQHEPLVRTNAKVEANIKDDPLYAYLWRGYHGRFLTDAQRDKRIASTREVLEFIPPNSVFTDYLAGAMPTTDAPVWFHVASALSLAAYLINRRAYVMEGSRRCFPLFWIGVLAGSGTMHKSASINPVRQRLHDDPDLGDTLVRATTWAQLIDRIGIELRRKVEDDTRPTAAEARSMCELADQEAQCLHGLAYFHLGEIATLLASLNKTYNEEAKPTLTDWWDCPPDDLYETKTAGKYYIYRPFVSILGASTVDWFVSGCKHSDLLGGFLPRWLFFANGVQDFQLSQPDATDETIAHRLTERCERLKEYRGKVELSKAAEDYYNDWYLANCKDRDKGMAAWLARLTVYAKKIALVFEAATSGGTTISESSTILACKLVSRIKAGLGQLLDEQLAFSDTDRNVKRFVEMVKSHGGRVEHWQALRAMHLSAERFKREIVTTAVEQGRIQRFEEKNEKNGKVAVLYLAV